MWPQLGNSTQLSVSERPVLPAAAPSAQPAPLMAKFHSEASMLACSLSDLHGFLERAWPPNFFHLAGLLLH